MATFNLRMDTEKDGVNAWPNRKEMVKGLIRFHDFDIFGTQEGFKHMLDGIAEWMGMPISVPGAMTARMRANIPLSSIRPVVLFVRQGEFLVFRNTGCPGQGLGCYLLQPYLFLG